MIKNGSLWIKQLNLSWNACLLVNTACYDLDLAFTTYQLTNNKRFYKISTTVNEINLLTKVWARIFCDTLKNILN